MRTLQDSEDMLKLMADSMNLSVHEFTKMMDEEDGLVPPDDEKESDDDYLPPKRLMQEIAITPDDARVDADKLRKMLLNPKLTRDEAEEVANDLAIRVSAYHEVDQRLEELRTPRQFESNARCEAERLEYNALTHMKLDKDATTHTSDSLSSTARTLGLMNRGKLCGRPIDLIAYKESIEKQMDELIASGTAREKRITKFVILAEGAAEKLMIEATLAPTAEATAMVMEKATHVMGKATKMLKELDEMATPKMGRVIEPVPDKQLPNQAKKLLKKE